MKRTVALVVAVGIPFGLVTSPPAGADDAIDACSLLTEAEVASVIGDIHPGYGNRQGAVCLWRNADKSASVGLFVGPPESAGSGPMSLEVIKSRDGMRAGPDGMLIYEVPNSNVVKVDFAADGRTCSVTIENSASLKDRESAEVDLARKVQDRLQ